MFSRKLFVAFLTLALTSFTVQAAPQFAKNPSIQQQSQQCDNNARTVTRTVTVTAAPPAKTSSKGNVAATKPINNGSSNTNNNGGNNGGKTNTNTNTNSGKNTNTNTNNGGKNTNTNTNTGGKNTNTNTGGKNTNTNTGGKNTNTNTGGKNTGTNNNGGKTTTNNNGGNNGGNNNGGGTTTTNNNGGNNNNQDPQTSLTLDPRVIAKGFANDGQDIPTDGQVASLTSTNNFINFCLTVPNLPITNGKQITTGSCNPAPIGVIPSTDNMPSSKFAFPANFGAVKSNTAFTIKMNIKNMQTGFFVNAQENYFAAPQFLNAQGQIQGHSHVVVEQLSSFAQTTTTDPKKFAFFKGLNAAAQGGQLTADVTAGLPAGAYKLSSINSAANHQPVIVPVAQHGSLDDAIYFFVTDDGKPPANAPFQQGAANTGTGGGKTQTGTTASAPAASATGKAPTKISNGANGGRVVTNDGGAAKTTTNNNNNGGKLTNGANGGRVITNGNTNTNNNNNGGKVTNGANGGRTVTNNGGRN